MTNNLSSENLLSLESRALQLRIDSVLATTASGSGHPTSCMSLAEIVSTIFFNFLKYDVKNPKNANNDRFILSKGHAIPVVYAAWKQLGVITEKELLDLRKFDSVLEGHPTPRFEYNEAATGSLGQGLAIGVGMALNAKCENLDYKTYVVIGDGESSEGSIWEAAELASHYNLNNLISIVDCNRLGQSGSSIDGHEVEKTAKKFEAFGFQTFIVDGHNISEVFEALTKAQDEKSKPVAIIAKTQKGFGLKDIQNKNGFHGKPFTKEEVDSIISELKDNFKKASDAKIEDNYIPQMPSPCKSDNDSKKEIKIDINKDKNSELFDLGEKIATRKAFGYALASLGKESKDVFALDADVKNSTFTNIFEKDFPKKFIQCFIAEQSMVGISVGLQSRGKIPFAGTFGAFFSRAYDQIRMAGIGQNALRLSGSHCGVSIGQDGPSQMALEDLAMMRALPNSIVFYPSDGVSTYKLVEKMANYNNGISYIRTTRPAAPNLYKKDEEFEIGGCKVLRQSDKDIACLIGAGVTLHECLKAYEVLKEKGILVSVIDLYSVKPLDKKTIKEIALKSGSQIVTVEDHYSQGGLGEAVSSALVNENIKVEVMAVEKLPRSAKPEELLSFEEIDAESIVKKVLEIKN